MATRPAVRRSWWDSSGCWCRSRYSCSCSALIESRPERTADTAGDEDIAAPFSHVVGEQLPPAVCEDVGSAQAWEAIPAFSVAGRTYGFPCPGRLTRAFPGP